MSLCWNYNVIDRIRRFSLLSLLTLIVSAPVCAESLLWDVSTDPTAVGYMVYTGQSSGNYTMKIDVGSVNSYVLNGLVEGATYYYAVTAYNSLRMESGFSNEVSFVVPAVPPVASFSASATSGQAPFAMNFINSSTGTITSYAWTFGDGTTSTAQSPSHVYSTTGSYTVSLKVTGPGGSNTQTRNNYIAVTAAADATPPTAPTNVVAAATGSSSINLTWTASTDNIGVTGYRVERCQGAGCTTFAQVATPAGTSFSDSGLAPGTYYRYRVRATDAAGNLSGYSATAAATTNVAADTTAPTVPANVVAAATGSSSINLTWTASTDNIGVTGYRVERCQGAGCTTFAQVATPAGTSFSDSGLAPGTYYRYRVRAADAAGNLSGYSATAAATTNVAADTTAPTVPANVVAAATGSSSINLTWTASTDNIGVTGYRVERCQGAGCTTFAQVATPAGTSFSDSGLASGTYYRYRVRAADAAGNLSGYSATAAATTSTGSGSTIGETTIMPTVGLHGNGMIYAQSATLSTAGTVLSMSLYVDSPTPAASAILGIYDATGASGGPGKRLAVTPSFKLVHGWNTANVIAQAALPAGTYWLLVDNSDNPSFSNRTGTGGTSRFAGGYFSLPSTAPAMPNTVAGHWSVYATFGP